MSKIVTGIDVGSHHVKVVIAEESQDPRVPPQILGTGYAESRGVAKGYVTSPAEASRSVAAALTQAQKAARVKVKRAYVSVGGLGLEEAHCRGEVVVERGDSVVTERDVPRAAKASEATLPPAAVLNRKILHAIPLGYYVDGVRVLGRNPIGMKGSKLAVETLFITCLERHVDALVEAIEEAGVEVEDVVAGPIAASLIALSRMQKRVGCILLNIGSETLSAIVYEDSLPISLKVFPVGSADITNDLALSLRISPEEAEQLKAGAVLGATYPKKKVDDTITRRLHEMFKQVEQYLKKLGKDSLLPAGAVLTGGGAMAPFVIEAAKSVLRLPARIAALGEDSARWQLNGGNWAVAYGLTVWGAGGAELEGGFGGGFTDMLKGLWRWFKKFLP